MKSRSRAARLSAAVAAALVYVGTGTGAAQARNLVWDWTPGDDVAQDGSGVWNTTDAAWVDIATNLSTIWSNANPDSAIFGTGNLTPGADPTTPYNVDLSEPIVAQDITFNEAAGNAVYSVTAFGGGSLTLNGNVTKAQNDGQINYFVNTELSAGNHTFALADTGGDVAEFIVNGVVSGSGGLTLDNGGFEAWGTLALNQSNTYTGATSVSRGRLVITTAESLGAATSGTTISGTGRVAVGGGGASVPGALNIAEPITITRDTYGADGSETGSAALIFNNTGTAFTHTLSGQLTVDSTDARVQVNSNTLVIPGNIVEGPTVTPGTGVLTLGGDFAGQVNLTGDNTGIGNGGIRLIGGVQLNVTEENDLGGPTAPLQFLGSATLHPVGGFMANFGSHDINNDTFSGGINVDENQTFTIDQALGTTTTGGSLGKRGLGTMNINSTVDLRGGQTFFDAGVVNVNSSVTLHSLHLRSPVVNIGTGGSITTVTGFNAIGQDSTGTNGGPDIAVVNITGSGQLVQTNNVDFNVSDNANTQGTINLQDNGVLSSAGLVHVAKSTGGQGTINQSGNSTFTLTRNGNFTLVLGSRRGTGTYNLNGGTMTSAGEFYVGQGNGGGNLTDFGTGVFNMTGGTVNQNNWFVVGREGGKGTVDISGGVFNKGGGGNVPIGESQQDNLMTIRGNAQLLATTGELWVANGNNNKATLNVQDTAVVSLPNWFVVGRGGAGGILNLSGGTITKAGDGIDNNGVNGIDEHGEDGHTEIDAGGGLASTATVSGSAVLNINRGELRVGQGGGGNGTLTIQDTAAVNTQFWTVIGRGGGTGILNVSGGSLTKTGSAGNMIIGAGGGSNGTINQTGGTISNTGSETWINEGGVTGTWNFSGGTANLGRLDVGRNGGGSATLNMSGTAAMNAGIVRFGEGNSVTGTVNLDGGTLQATQVVDGNSTGAARLNLNGGLLRAGATNTTDWMTGGIAVSVKAGGANLDSNSFDVTLNSAFLHDSLLGATPDGGLTKSGAGMARLTGNNTWTGPTAVNAGTLELKKMHAGSAVSINGTSTLRVIESSPGLSSGHPSGDNASVSRPTTLSIAAGATLDITNNDVILDYTGASPVATYEALVASGYNVTGDWLGDGITSSIAALDGNYVVAIADNATLAAPFGTAQGGPLFAGVDVDLDTVLIKFTHRSDINLDGLITPDDSAIFGGNYDENQPAVWATGDMNYDGIFTPDDAAIFGGAYDESLASLPEPGSLAAIGLLGLGLTRRRRR